MRRDSTTYAAQAANPRGPGALPLGAGWAGVLVRLAGAMLAGALLIALAYQIPVTHAIDIGGYDAAYVQGFGEPLRNSAELAGSDGSARLWGADGALLLPQAGLPAALTLHTRSPDATLRDVVVLLNGAQELGRFQAGPQWDEHRFVIAGGLLKPNDVVIQLRADAPGVLLDRAEFAAGPLPITPYPPQIVYGALAAGMLALLLTRAPVEAAPRRAPFAPGWRVWAGATVLMALAFLLLYRAQPLYPYPLRSLLPTLDALLAALLAFRYAPAFLRRLPALPDALALGGIGAWAAALLLAGRQHLTLSVPGAENDFRVFALRSAHLAGQFPAGIDDPARDGVFRADGFYNLGYPLLLWLLRPFASDNAFLAARVVATLSGALLLLGGWLLARRLLGRNGALLALVLLALSPLVVEYGLYLGTDTPFAALCVLALALLLPTRAPRIWLLALAGVVAGAAFLVRHPGFLLLPFGWLAIWAGARIHTAARPALRTHLLAFTLAFLIAILPQIVVNLRDTGQPLYSQQAKNVWQGMFGGGDWDRWAGARNDIGITEVIALDLGRFLLNWWNNARGFIGTGGEDTREFGQALQLRLLGFPANWLAVGGLLGWLALLFRSARRGEGATVGEGETRDTSEAISSQPLLVSSSRVSLSRVSLSPASLSFIFLLLWVALYVAAISVGLPLQGRFVLPLAPIYAAAAAWLVLRLPGRAPLLAAIVLLAFLWGGFATGTQYVLRAQPSASSPGQPADELAIIRSVQARVQPGERIIVRADPRAPLGKYSAIAHLVLPAPAADTPDALRASGASYLIWSSALGPAPALGPPLETAGIYQLYHL
jgi:4-amino-4-deoxy-L-arabinose transferase-like glycosyltransferase